MSVDCMIHTSSIRNLNELCEEVRGVLEMLTSQQSDCILALFNVCGLEICSERASPKAFPIACCRLSSTTAFSLAASTYTEDQIASGMNYQQEALQCNHPTNENQLLKTFGEENGDGQIAHTLMRPLNDIVCQDVSQMRSPEKDNREQDEVKICRG